MKIPGLRWWIVVLVFGAAVLNYVDRQTLSALAPTIQADLKMDDREYANIVNLFLVAYTVAYLISGKLVDRLGTRTGMVLFVIWWSLANMVTAAPQGVRSMGVGPLHVRSWRGRHLASRVEGGFRVVSRPRARAGHRLLHDGRDHRSDRRTLHRDSAGGVRLRRNFPVTAEFSPAPAGAWRSS